MTSALETIRYHSGIAGEEVADMVDSLEQEVSTLREQVEKLTKELDNVKQVEFPRRVQKVTDALKRKHEKQLSALAEQNAKFRKVLLRLACLGNGDQYGNSIGNCIAQETLSLPNLATPVLNRIRAEGMREAEKIVRKRVQWVSNGQGIQYRSTAPESISAESLADEIRDQAAELEKTNG